MQANKTADNQYLIPLIDGTIENIDITDGILLTTSEFVSQEDIEMTTTHDDLSLFQISFCIDGNMEWSYINNEVVHQFQIAAQQSQVRYGTFKESPSRYKSGIKRKPVIFCGDLNVAYTSLDIANPDRNHFNPGFSDQERGKFGELLDAGFVDSFRYLHPGERQYSWWSYRFKARERNIGWRIDYFLVSDFAADKINAAEIRTEVYGSDHCPIVLDIDL